MTTEIPTTPSARKALKVGDLKTLLSERGLDTDGTKNVLLQRLEDFLAAPSETAEAPAAEAEPAEAAPIEEEPEAPAEEEKEADVSGLHCFQFSKRQRSDCVHDRGK